IGSSFHRPHYRQPSFYGWFDIARTIYFRDELDGSIPAVFDFEFHFSLLLCGCVLQPRCPAAPLLFGGLGTRLTTSWNYAAGAAKFMQLLKVVSTQSSAIPGACRRPSRIPHHDHSPSRCELERSRH